MKDDQLEEASALLDQLTAPMFEERAPGVAFFGFYLHDQASDLENDEVLDRFAAGRGVYAVELVWNDELDLEQRGEGRVVRTLADLRALAQRLRDVSDGMEQVQKSLGGLRRPATAPAPTSPSGPSSWVALRTGGSKAK